MAGFDACSLNSRLFRWPMPAARTPTETLPPLLEARGIRRQFGLTQSNSRRSLAFGRRRRAPESATKPRPIRCSRGCCIILDRIPEPALVPRSAGARRPDAIVRQPRGDALTVLTPFSDCHRNSPFVVATYARSSSPQLRAASLVPLDSATCMYLVNAVLPQYPD